MTSPLIANRYHYLQDLGAGAMGVVTLVEDGSNGQQVALKVIADKLAMDPAARQLFRREYLLMRQLEHPNCCRALDYDHLPSGLPYYTMEAVFGTSPQADEPLDAELFRPLFAQLMRALGYLHGLGYIHRDVKSANVIVRPDGVLKLMDYGLLEYAGKAGCPINGTLAYMAPEVVKRGPLDQRADLYSAGVMAYELLTGQVPFRDLAPLEILRAHVNLQPARPSTLVPGLDPRLDAIIMKLLAKDPLERYQSTLEVLRDLGVEEGEWGGLSCLLVSPLIGREREVDRLARAVRTLVAGESGEALALCGPAGIGKSRLVEEFRGYLALEGLACGVGACFEQGGAAYGPFVAALRGLMPRLASELGSQLDGHAAVLAKLLPELGTAPAVELDSPIKEKLRLQTALGELLLSLARHQGFALVLEDWQWADPLSRELLDHLLRMSWDVPLLFLLTSRPDGVVGLPERVSTLELGPLGPEALRRMVTSMLGTEEVDARFLADVAELTEGVPFFAERLIGHLVQGGLLPLRAGGGWDTAIDLKAAALPEDLHSLLLKRIAGLPEHAQRIARLLAVSGRETRLELLGEVLELDDEQRFRAIEALDRALVVTQQDGGGYRFAQDQFGELLYATMTPQERTATHARLGMALEGRLASEDLQVAPLEELRAIARHYLTGFVPERTLTFALAAGLRSAELLAVEDAERFLAAALALLAAEPPSEACDRRRLAALHSLADVRRLSGKVELARALYAEAMPLAEQLGDPRMQARLLLSQADTCQSVDDLAGARTNCERSLERARQSGDLSLIARGSLLNAMLDFMDGHMSDALHHAEEALDWARRADDPAQIGEALAFAGYLYVVGMPDKLELGAQHLGEAIELLEAVGNRVALKNAYGLLGAALHGQGDYNEAWEAFSRNRQLCFELGVADEEAFAYLNLSLTAIDQGRVEDGVLLAREARTLGQRLNSDLTLGLASTFEALASAYMGKPAEAKQCAREALALMPRLNNKFLEARLLEHRVALLTYLGALDEAQSTAETLESLMLATGNTEPEAHLGLLSAELLARAGNLGAARERIWRALHTATLSRSKGLIVKARRVRAWIALRADEHSEARQLATEALALSYQIGMRHQTAELQGLLGEIALAAGTGDAAPFFRAMESLASELESKPLRAQALFGLAACAPYMPESVGQKEAAQRLIAEVLAGLDGETRADFLRIDERARVREGNVVGFSLPARSQASIKVTSPGMDLRKYLEFLN